MILAALMATASADAATVSLARNDTEAEQEAINALPLDQLTPAAQEKLCDVLARPTIYRRLPTEVISCDRDMYLTLVRNPDVIVNIWQLMGVTDVSMDRTGPFAFDCDDKAGTQSQIELLYGTHATHVYFASTCYEGPLLARPVKARVVLLLRSQYDVGDDGAQRVTCVMDAFIRIDHLTAKLIARTLSPLVCRTADHNFIESTRFLERVSKTAEENGPGMERLATQLENVQPDVQAQFAQVSAAVFRRAMTRNVPAASSVAAAPTAAPRLGEPAGTAALETVDGDGDRDAHGQDEPNEAPLIQPVKVTDSEPPLREAASNSPSPRAPLLKREVRFRR